MAASWRWSLGVITPLPRPSIHPAHTPIHSYTPTHSQSPPTHSYIATHICTHTHTLTPTPSTLIHSHICACTHTLTFTHTHILPTLTPKLKQPFALTYSHTPTHTLSALPHMQTLRYPVNRLWEDSFPRKKMTSFNFRTSRPTFFPPLLFSFSKANWPLFWNTHYSWRWGALKNLSTFKTWHLDFRIHLSCDYSPGILS